MTLRHDCKDKRAIKKFQTLEEDFINVHGNRFDYSQVEYKNNYTKIKIICPEHGEFYQTPSNHLQGQKCPICSDIEAAEKRTKNTSQFIKKANIIHNNKYDYSKAIYKGSNVKVKIICPEHGEFEKKADQHLGGVGCPVCGKIYRKKYISTKDFIKKSREIHGTQYSYIFTEYKGSNNNVIVTCKTHGDFLIYPHNHISGSGCPECGKIKAAVSRRKTSEEFIETVSQVHKGKYDYSDIQYKNNNTKIKIICPEHGEFYQTPSNHQKGHGCPKCGDIKASILKTKTTKRFIKEAKEIHGERFNYSLTQYIDYYTPIKIICSEHGIFEQLPYNHLKYSGCPTCGRNKTAYETYKDQKTILYYINIGGYYKFGLTKSSVKERYRYENIDYEIIMEREFDDGFNAWLIEQEIKYSTIEYSVDKYESPIKGGYSEIRNHDIKETIIEIIKKVESVGLTHKE